MAPPSTVSREAQAHVVDARSAAARAGMPNPIIPNSSGEYGNGSLPDFQVPKRAMGSTGLQVSILGMGGFHLGTVTSQDEVNNMLAKAEP